MTDRTPYPEPAEPILHVDMDAFYAAVEMRDDPRLSRRPVVVGGGTRRGVVCSASYEARAFGVGSAMPMAVALRRCPDAVVVAPRFAVYRQVSRRLRAIFESVTPLVEPLALDEAFLDVSGAVRLFGPPVAIGAHVRGVIADELGLPASVGVAANKFLAKVCSRRAKPDGLLHLPVARVAEFLDALPVGELWGVGARTADVLAGAGIRWVRDLRDADADTVVRLVGPALAQRLTVLASGRDQRTVQPDVDAKGLSAERTFAIDLTGTQRVRHVLLDLCEQVGARLRDNEVGARTVTIKVREASFVTRTRSRTLSTPTTRCADLHATALDLLDTVWRPPAPLRLLGVGAARLVPAAAGRQLDLLDDDRWDAAERVADRVRAQFGDVALVRGALLDTRDCGAPAPTRDDLAVGRARRR